MKYLLILFLSLVCLCPTQSQTIPGLVAAWRFNGNFADSSGYGFNGTGMNSPSFTSDRYGNANSALVANGTSTYVRAGDILDTLFCKSPNAQFSVSGWFKPSARPAFQGGGIIVAKTAGGSGPDQWSINFDNDGYVKVIFKSNALTNFIEWKTADSAKINQWAHFTAVFDGSASAANSRVRIFLNGTGGVFSRAGGTMGTTCANSTQEITIGSGHAAGNPASPNNLFNGAIDDIRIYNRVLSGTEISVMYYNFANVFYSKASGNLNQLSSWGTNPDGSGSAPSSFIATNTLFAVANNPAPTISADWSVLGINTRLLIGDGVNNFNLSIPTATTLNADTFQVTANAVISVSGALTSRSFSCDSLSSIQFVGSSNQTIPAGTYYDLSVFGSAKSLAGTTIVKNNLNMFADVNTGANVLSLGQSSGQRGTLNYSSGIVSGRFIRWFTTATNSGSTGLFPVGIASSYRPITIAHTSAPSTGGAYMAEFIPSAPGNTGLPVFDVSISPAVFIDKAGINGYWKLTPVNGISGGTYSISCQATGFYGINDYTKLRLITRTSASGGWAAPGTSSTPTGSTSAPVISRSGVASTYLEFGIGSNQSVNPLPVTFLHFSGVIAETTVRLTWSTASEHNVAAFAVMRSIDGFNFIKIGEVSVAGNSSQTHSYLYNDNLSAGIYHTQYYQVREISPEGIYGDFSNVITPRIDPSMSNFGVYPNPTVEGVIYSIPFAFATDLIVRDYTGKLIETRVIPANCQAQIQLPAKGVYFISFKNEEEMRVVKVLY